MHSLLEKMRMLMICLIKVFFKQAVESESQDLELDLSSLGTVNTMFAALFRSVHVACNLYVPFC